MAFTSSDDLLEEDKNSFRSNTRQPPQLVTKERREERARRGVVKFKDTVQVRATTHGKSDQKILEERNARWYSQHELLQMRKRHIQVILSLDSVSQSDRELLKNVYGIDSVESRNVRQDRIRSVRFAVLEEQEKLWNLEQTPDNEETKELSNRVHLASVLAAKEAQLRGILVMREVVRDTIQEVQSEPTVSYKKVGPLGVGTRAKSSFVNAADSFSLSPVRRLPSSTFRKARRSSSRWTRREDQHDSSRLLAQLLYST